MWRFLLYLKIENAESLCWLFGWEGKDNLPEMLMWRFSCVAFKPDFPALLRCLLAAKLKGKIIGRSRLCSAFPSF